VALLDRDGAAAEGMAKEIGDGSARGYRGDVTDSAVIDAVLEDVIAAWGGVDDLVNNAGVWDHAPLLDLTWRNGGASSMSTSWRPSRSPIAAVCRMARSIARELVARPRQCSIARHHRYADCRPIPGGAWARLYRHNPDAPAGAVAHVA